MFGLTTMFRRPLCFGAPRCLLAVLFLLPCLGLALPARALIYDVGPGQDLASIGEVPWATLQPGDVVQIHWRPQPYAEKWVIGVSGTAAAPIVVRGVKGPGGERPLITGEDAVTAPGLNYWNEPRGLLKIGGTNVPADGLPSYLIIEGLHLRSARPAYSFTDDQGAGASYTKNAAAFYVEKAAHLTLRDCELSDSGNGLFIGVNGGQTQDILIEGNFLHNNGISGSAYEHNSYTSALGITFQYNHYGPLRPGCDGNNLKDRSAGLVVRYNWIESGNRQLDLVDGEDDPSIIADPRYRQTFVYGNVLIEPDGAGNSQIVHYGGDSGNLSIYRKGTLYFFHNTVLSTRGGNTTLLRLSSNEEHAELRNNLVYTSAPAGRLALLSSAGQLSLSHNGLPAGYVSSHDGAFSGSISDDGSSLDASAPGFVGLAGQDFHLGAGSMALNAGGPLSAAALPDHLPLREYQRHLGSTARGDDGLPDLGAFERCEPGRCQYPDAGGGADGGSPDGGVVSDAGGGTDGGGSADGGSDAGPGQDGGGDGGDGSGSNDAGSNSDGSAAGCGCSAGAGGRSNAVWSLLLLGTLALRRRKCAKLGRKGSNRLHPPQAG